MREGGSEGGSEGGREGGKERKVTKPYREQSIHVARYQVAQIMHVRTYITLSAVIPCLHMHATVVTSVDKAIAGLIMKFIEHRHGGILGPAERGELPVSLT